MTHYSDPPFAVDDMNIVEIGTPTLCLRGIQVHNKVPCSPCPVTLGVIMTSNNLALRRGVAKAI